MRLIDADAAIDTLKELTANGTNKGMVFGEDAVHRIEILPSVQSEQRWVPCSKRLPEESRKYLVTVFDGVGKRTTSALYHRRSKSWTLTGRMAYWKVIAWKPLPEPYQGVER